MSVHYFGEHLLPGELGKILVWISFFATIAATVFYSLRSFRKEPSGLPLKSLSRGFFLIHAFSMIAVAVVLYWLIFNHYFEYSYVWEYSSRDLPVKYIISCFWAGQEGSFMLWAIAQAVIGVILVFRAKDWENNVMSVVSLSQVFVTSMLLGIQLGALKIGTSPFHLLRETYAGMKDTIFQDPNYLLQIKDGNGLNPLLENIWMTIHPPILFVGYALALVPFSYAIASFFRKDFVSWIKPAITWSVLSLTLLGSGILMGGAWAYVSLTFGGFWSWDPVENSSLVPWLTLLAGLHFMIIARKQQYSLFMAYIFVGLSYVLVLYASFLTRSGVLSDTSAHSFGDNGLTTQLLLFLLAFLIMMIVMISINTRKFYEKRKEILLSKEFWMFIGAVIIVLSAFQIILSTSLPVFNKVFGTGFAPPSGRVEFYNRWQMPYTVLITAFIAFSQLLNYNENNPREFLKKMILPLGTGIVITIPFILQNLVSGLNASLMFLFIVFSIIASINNLIFRTSSPRNWPAIITHIGFGIFLIGTLLTFSNSKTISINTSGYDLGDERKNSENLMMVRNDTLYMGEYYLTYSNNILRGNTTEYQVDFLKREKTRFVKKFSLYPTINRHPRMGEVSNPDTRHFLMRDYYMYVSIAGKDPDYIVIKAIMNPFINILWFGAILMVAGLSYAFVKRMRRKFSNFP